MKISEENTLKILLSYCDVRGISYVSWKNNHELNLVFSGERDIDLYVPVNQRSNFLKLCKEMGWVEFSNPVACYPDISHFYTLGNDLEIFHLHVYFKLITGDTWIKEYLLPFDEWLLENRVLNEEYGIWVLNNQSQSYIFLIRHLLKCGSFIGRLMYKRELESYREEWNQCSKDFGENELNGPISLSDRIDLSIVSGSELKLPSLLNSLKFRFSCSPYLRHNTISLPFIRFFSLCNRVLNKIFYKQKKVFTSEGIVIAISGVDGSGKSTMLRELSDVFGKFLTIRSFHLGKPQGKFIESIWRAMGNKSTNASMAGTSSNNLPSSKIRAFNGMILALMRLRLARSIIKLSRKGGLMVTDRWPTNELGKMDGPRIILGEESGWVETYCKKIESWAYNVMPSADVCYFFEVPIEIAASRNRYRVKENKETDEMIHARYANNYEYEPISRKTIRFDNSEEFEIKRKEFLSSIWQQISLMS